MWGQEPHLCVWFTLKIEHLSRMVTEFPLMKRLNTFILAGSHLVHPGLSPQKVHVGRRLLLPESTLRSCESSYHIGPPLQKRSTRQKEQLECEHKNQSNRRCQNSNVNARKESIQSTCGTLKPQACHWDCVPS